MTKTKKQAAAEGISKKPKRIPFKDWVASLPFDERHTHARRSLKGASNVAHFLVSLHETNRIALHSDALSSQIPRSHAGNAYNNFTRSLLELELVRLCSIWYKGERDAFSIPTVIGLIDGSQVIDCMAREMADHYRTLDRNSLIVDDADEEEIRQIRELLDQAAERDWSKEYDRIRRMARNTIRLARLVAGSKTLENVRNFRNKHIAHATALTHLERESGPVPAPKIGDERRLLRVTLKILERLDLCVRGVGFDWSNSERIAKRNAEALWHGVTIKVLR
jgi:hypothetical protein